MKRSDLRQSLAIQLFKLPLDRLVDALDAIDELDMHILRMHEDKRDLEATAHWREEVSRRRIGRQQFLELRLNAEVTPLQRPRGH